MAISETIKKMPSIAISLLVFFAILMIGGLFMYKTADVATSVVTNTTHQEELAARADSFNTVGDELVSAVTVVVSLIVIFVLLNLVLYMVRTFKDGNVSGGDGML